MTAKTAELPFDVRLDMLDSLFGRANVLVTGLIGHVACMVVCWSATGDRAFLLWIPYFAGVVIFRLLTFRRFQGLKPGMSSFAELDRWESIYVFGGFLVAAGVGVSAGYGMVTAPDTVAGPICMGLVGGSMISVVGRNFGSKMNAKLMTLACCLPLMAGILLTGYLRGDLLLALIGLPLLVVITSSIDMSNYLHDLLLGALRTTRLSEVASHKFNAAVSSMPNGLLMVDGNNTVIVANDRARDMLGHPRPEGMRLAEALSPVMPDPYSILGHVLGPGLTLDGEEVTRETVDGRWLRFRVRHLTGLTKKYMDEEWGGRQDGAYVITILDVSSRVAADREMEHLARYDGLTQMANRRYWEEATEAAVKALPAGTLVGLAVLDVDRFKLINDTLGHHVGDQVIRGVADRIRSVGDSRMIAGRLGGDEFVVLLAGPRCVEDATEFYDRVFSAISTTYPIEGHGVEVRCSGGVIVRTKEQFNLHADMSRADMALYKVKRTPRMWMLFDDRLEQEYQSSIRIKHDLRKAIDEGKLQVVYQPIYDARGQRIVSAEALCRWEHEAGFIAPSEFIAMAEEIGVIGKLTEYVLRTACRDCMSWESDVTVAVNLSALDLARDGIVDMISNALAERGMPAERLCIEVTETVFVKDFEKTAATLTTLRNMGVKTSLDDFGTGYSSLSYLGKLPLNRVKIDKSFVNPIVEDPKARQLFGTVVGLAKGLGFEVVVEGVEERKQLEMVLEVPGIDMIQGHIFSEGLSNADMRKVASVKRPAWSGSKVIRLIRDGK